jgi:hypothetical protein
MSAAVVLITGIVTLLKSCGSDSSLGRTSVSQTQTVVLNNTTPSTITTNSPPKVVVPVVIQRGGEVTSYGYTVPPRIQIAADDEEGFHQDAIRAYLGKVSQHGKTLPPVRPTAFKVDLARNSKSLTAELDTATLLPSLYERPYGYYDMQVDVSDVSNILTRQQCRFSYTYKESFLPLEKAVVPHAAGFKNIRDIGGMMVQNTSTRGGFCSADLRQRFDFKTNFVVHGFFTIKNGNGGKPATFNIDFLDGWGERIAVLLADGNSTTYTLKVYGEQWGPLITFDASTMGRHEIDVVNDGRTLNYFMIHVTKHSEGKSRWSLFVGRKQPDPEKDLYAHSRLIDDAALGSGSLGIKFKLWGTGILSLYEFEVAELPSRQSREDL